MTWRTLTFVLCLAWLCLTGGLVMLTGSWSVVPLSAGIALAVLAWIDLRAKVAAEVAEKDEAST